MSVSRIQLQGKLIELDKEDFLSLIDGIGKNTSTIARAIHQAHELGSINANGSSQTQFLRFDSDENRALIAAVEDKELRTDLDKLVVIASRLKAHDKEIVVWLGSYFGILSVDRPADRKRLNRKLSEERRKAADAGSGLLNWIDNPDYQSLTARSLNIANELAKISERISKRVSVLTKMG